MSLVSRYGARKWISRLISLYAKILIKLLGIKYSVNEKSYVGELPFGSLIISNHLSYLDVVVLAAHHASCFVTSIEMRQSIGLGQICEVGGCLYVERRSRAGLGNEVKDIANALSAGLSVIVFPEATSTNGEEVRRFKRPLFRAAMSSGADIIPVALNYKFLNSKKVTLANRDNLFWYGDMEFLSHFWRVLGQRNMEIDLFIGEPIKVKDEDDTSSLAELTHNIISKAYEPVLS